MFNFKSSRRAKNLIYALAFALFLIPLSFGIFAQSSRYRIQGDITNDVNFRNVPADFSFSYAAGSSNEANVIVTAKDKSGQAVPYAQFVLFLSDSSAGAGLTGTAASGTPAPVSTFGEIIGILTAKKAWIVQANSSGVVKLLITDTSKTLYYPVAYTIFSRSKVGTRLATGNYG